MQKKKLFIGINLNLVDKLKKCPRASKIAYQKHIDKYHYVLDCFYRRKALQDNYPEDSKNENVKLYSVALKEMLTTRFYKHVLNDLEAIGIIEKVSNYSTAIGRSNTYTLCEPYDSLPVVQVEIEDAKLAKKIEKKITEANNKAVADSFARKHIKKCVELLEIDGVVATRWVNQYFAHCSDLTNVMNEKVYRQLIIQLYLDRDFFYAPASRKKGEKDRGRFYHLLTSTSSDLRHFLSFQGKDLISVDISNCQPCLLTTLYPDRFSFEAKRYADLIKNDRFYAFINERLLKPKDLDLPEGKTEVKKLVYAYFFDKNSRTRFYEVHKIFEKEFPILHEIILSKKAGKHNRLAVYLQNIEAKVVIDQVIEELAQTYSDGCFISLHDGIITTKEYVEKVEKCLSEKMKDILGFNPHIKTKAFCEEMKRAA